MHKYSPPGLLFNGHLQTIFPALFRKVELPKPYVRKRIYTEDDDFLDLDYLLGDHNRVVIISHGLEGDSHRPYVKGMARTMLLNGFDVIAWNFRGCSGEVNKQLRMYHSGATQDLRTVVNHATKDYNEIYVVGFSLGGNLTLKFTGENQFPDSVKKACGIAAPLDLKSGAVNLGARKNYFYQKRFLKSLAKKCELKSKQYPDQIDMNQVRSIDTIYEFDEHVTAPIHGFDGADHYYESCSSKGFLAKIKIPSLILNAYNDPFLTPEILDPSIGSSNEFITYEITSEGGHCGYPTFSNKNYWSELKVLRFFLD